MSAFICDPEHIIELAAFAADRDRSGPGGTYNVPPHFLSLFGGEDMRQKDPHDAATYYANILWQENVRSVRARYPGDTWETLPGPCVKPIALVVSRQRMNQRRVREPVALLKMCDCYEYQACESDDWESTQAHRLLGMIRKAAIHRLPGYDDAPWEYSRAHEAAA